MEQRKFGQDMWSREMLYSSAPRVLSTQWSRERDRNGQIRKSIYI